MLDVARTLSASAGVHVPTGSSRPGVVPAVTLGATVVHQPACGHASDAYVPAVDAEVIDLAGRVRWLAEREQRLWDRATDIGGTAFQSMSPKPKQAEGKLHITTESMSGRTATA